MKLASDRALPLAGLLIACAAACSPAPPPPSPPAAVATPAAPAPAPSSAHAIATNTVASSAPMPASPSKPPKADAASIGETAGCPDGMLLVDGDYCDDLETTCLEKFYAPQNHLWVCKRVKEPTACRSSLRHVRYCIDRYEFPNRKGQRPMIMQNFYQAQVHCAAGGKRVCTETEWTKACEGPDNKPFPYGYTRDPSVCLGDKTYGFPDKKKVENRDLAELERLWQAKPSGSAPGCVSDYGVYDMPGNADELAASETKGGAKSDYDNVTTGGPWYFGTRNACRPKIYTHDESFAYYYLSWRCCAEADGQPTDPRAPKQIARRWTMERVRNIASNSWKLPFNPKLPGDSGYSPAGADRPSLPGP